MKRCCGCIRDLPITAFQRNSSRRDGVQTVCRECRKTIDAKRYQTHKDSIEAKKRSRWQQLVRQVRAYLVEHPCVDCGERDPVVLEFDHVRGKKTAAVSELLHNRCSWGRISSEIAKCDVRCANCHRRKTADELKYFNGT